MLHQDYIATLDAFHTGSFQPLPLGWHLWWWYKTHVRCRRNRPLSDPSMSRWRLLLRLQRSARTSRCYLRLWTERARTNLDFVLTKQQFLLLIRWRQG